jgi:hypothetical protein
MSDMNNEESQLLDDDVVPQEYPPDQPLGVDERLTPIEEQSGETLGHRVAREVPDDLGIEDERTGDYRQVGTLVDAGDEYNLDLEADMVASEIAPEVPLEQLDSGDLAFGDDTLRDVTQEKEGTMPAEEAAMHLTDPPPMGDGDGYLED